MENRNTIFLIIVCSILICFSAFYLEMNQISQYSDLLIYFGSLSLILGIIIWLIEYKKSKGRFPQPLIDYSDMVKKNSQSPNKHFAIFGYFISHFKEFIVIVFLFINFTTLIFTQSIKSSDLYKTSLDYVKNDQEINKSIGAILKTGFIISKQNLQNGNYEFRYNVIGEKGILDTRIILKQTENNIEIDSLYYD